MKQGLELVSALRSRLLQVSGTTTPATLHGHADDGAQLPGTHLAITALPFVGHRHANSLIYGFALALPAGLDRAELDFIGQLDRIRWHAGELSLAPVSVATAGQYTLNAERWCRPAQIWTSVTPVILPGQVKPGRSPAPLIARACQHAGLPAPVEIITHKYGGLPGIAPSPAFQLPAKRTQGRHYLHATVRFTQPVRGPVLLGAGRYFGSGLMAPVDREATP
jgi:CRISPR-associated protein Csb2